MALVPFAMKKAENFGFWLICLTFGISLAIVNYAMAVGAIGKVRDNESLQAAAIIRQAKTLQARISSAEKSLSSLPAFRFTTPEMVETGKEAVRLAEEAKTQECGTTQGLRLNLQGDNCRARTAQLANRQAELATLSSDFAQSERKISLDKSIEQWQSELTGLGRIPEHSDPQAERLAKLVGKFIDLGETPATTAADGLITVLAIVAEAFALGMPRIIVTALSGGELSRTNRESKTSQFGRWFRFPSRSRSSDRGEPSREVQGRPALRLSEPKPEIQILAKPTPKFEAPKLKLKPPAKLPALAFGNVATWKVQNLAPSRGDRLSCWEGYTSYKLWAEAQKLPPHNFNVFKTEMASLGVEVEEVLKKPHFKDVKISSSLKVVA